MDSLKPTPTPSQRPGHPAGGNGAGISAQLRAKARADSSSVLQGLASRRDGRGEPSEKVLHYGYLNSYHQAGLKNLLDETILGHEELEERFKAKEKFRKIDETPFDFARRRMSVVVEDETGLNTLICKGAVDEVMSLCTRVGITGRFSLSCPNTTPTAGRWWTS